MAAKIVDRFAEYLGNALGIFGCVVDPEIFVIGGGVSKAGQPLIDAVKKYYQRDAFLSCKDTPIVLAKLDNDAGKTDVAAARNKGSGQQPRLFFENLRISHLVLLRQRHPQEAL